MPFDDESFDRALSVHTMYFWSDPASCLGEIRRVLRPGARLALGFLRADSPGRARFPREVYAFYDEGDVKAMLAAAAFEFDTILADRRMLPSAVDVIGHSRR